MKCHVSAVHLLCSGEVAGIRECGKQDSGVLKGGEMQNVVWRGRISPWQLLGGGGKIIITFPPSPISISSPFLRLNKTTRTINMASKSHSFKIILGSASVARKAILTEMGYNFQVLTADIDEKGIRKETPEDLVMALAEAKANAIMSILQNTNVPGQNDESTLLITADTVVVYDGAVREKPSSKEEAREFIKGYSGGHAAAVGSVLVTNLKTGSRKGAWDRVEIYFHHIPDELIDKLIEEGIVLNVAGALIIEHPLILPVVKEVIGTTDSVMGLPKALTEELIQEVL